MLKAETQKAFQKKVLYIKPYWGNKSLNQKYIRILGTLNVKCVLTTSTFCLKDFCLKSANVGDDIFYVSNKIDAIAYISMLFGKCRNTLNFVMIDDGVGSYSNFLHLYKTSINEKNALKMLLLFPFYYLLKRIVEKLVKAHHFGMLDMNTLNTNDEFVKYFRKALSLTIARKDDIPEKNLLVFCSQPYIDLGRINEADYAHILEEVNKYSESKKLKLLVAKHPADTSFNYSGYEITPTCGSFEEFAYLYSAQISEVWSINSTCLITASAIFDINSKSVDCSLSRKQKKSFSNKMIKLFNKFTLTVDVEAINSITKKE